MFALGKMFLMTSVTEGDSVWKVLECDQIREIFSETKFTKSVITGKTVERYYGYAVCVWRGRCVGRGDPSGGKSSRQLIWRSEPSIALACVRRLILSLLAARVGGALCLCLLVCPLQLSGCSLNATTFTYVFLFWTVYHYQLPFQ